MSHATSTLRLYHEAALDSLHALVRLQDLVLRYAQLPCEQRSVLRIETLCQESLVSFMQGLQKIAENPERTYSIERMTAARLALGRDLLKFRNIQAPSAHELVFAASIFFVRLWNRRARPAAFDIPPLTGSGSWQFVLYAPQEEMDLGRFLDEAHQCLHDYNPLLLDAELKLEYAKAAEILQLKEPAAENRIQREGGIWHLHYQGVSGDYSVQGNQSIGWLAKLLAAPNCVLAVAELRGDPEGKLAADAMMRAEPETDRDGIAEIMRRIREIDEIAEETGGSETLEGEKVKLLDQLKGPTGKMLDSPLRRAHRNIATQLRTLMRKKLKKTCPIWPHTCKRPLS